MKMHVIPFPQSLRRYQRGSVDSAGYSSLGARDITSLDHAMPFPAYGLCVHARILQNQPDFFNLFDMKIRIRRRIKVAHDPGPFSLDRQDDCYYTPAPEKATSCQFTAHLGNTAAISRIFSRGTPHNDTGASFSALPFTDVLTEKGVNRVATLPGLLTLSCGCGLPAVQPEAGPSRHVTGPGLTKRVPLPVVAVLHQ